MESSTNVIFIYKYVALFHRFHSNKSRGDFMAGTNYNEKPPINMNWSVLWTKIIMLFCFLFCAVYFLLSTLAIFCPFYLHISIRVSDGKVFRFIENVFEMEKAGSLWKTYSTPLAYEVCCVFVVVVVVVVVVSGRYKQGIMCNSIKRRKK